MPTTFPCACGQPLAAADRHAGVAVRCPSCGRTPATPPAPADDPPLFTRPISELLPSRPGDKPWKKGAAAEPEPDPGRLAREREAPAGGGGKSLEGRVLNGGVAGGVLAMVIAVVWFFAGLAADRIFFYPPVLFVIGLFAFCKGLAGGESEPG